LIDVADTIATAAKTRSYRTRVSRSGELRRIEALPRRDWQAAADLDELTRRLTERLRTPQGTMTLWPVQAAALRELYDYRGLFGPIAVGHGKALISLLAGELLGADRPLLIVPAALRDQTLDIVIPEMRQHWRIPDALEIRGYEELCRADRADEIESIAPDLIILDEAHRVKNLKAAVTRRISRYKQRRPTTIIAALSGSMTSRSLRDYWHLARWALGDRLVPMPTSWNELADWADALDERVPDQQRVGPGAIGSDIDAARAWFCDRLVQTPGVIATGANEIGTALRIDGVYFPIDPTIARMLGELRERWSDPNGDPIMEAVALWRAARQLSLGYWQRWDPPPPREWMEARTEWGRLVRHVISHNRRGIDTEKQVFDDCINRNDTDPGFTRWRAIRDSYTPQTVVEWVSDFAIDAAAGWLEERKGIVWTGSPEFGARLAKRVGVTYYGAGDSTIANAAGPVVASRHAHGTGKNLQQWSANLIVDPPSSGKITEQLIGRTHRPGQLADEVTVEIFQHTDEMRAALEQSRADADYIEATLGTRQKLCYADCSIARLL